MRQKLLLLAAVFFGILAFIFAYQQLSLEKKKIQRSTIELEVITLKKALAGNEEITAEHLAPLKVRRSLDGEVSKEIPWSKRNQIIGRKVNMVIPQGTILTWFSIDQGSEESGRTGLTTRISNENDPKKPKKYAIAIPVDAISSLSGLIRPKNRVDVIGTFHLPETKDPKLETVTLTLLQNVTVLACGTDMGDQTVGQRGPRSYSTMILEVTLDQAELLVFAQQKGRITLALRNHENSKILPARPPVNWDEFLQKINSQQKNSDY